MSSALSEDDLLPLSALSHLVYCERRCALVHIEQVWEENRFTLEGSHMHERAHDAGPRREVRGDLVICRGLPVRSFALGVSGIADVVEFHRVPARPAPGGGDRLDGLALPDLGGVWRPFPVEYKRGKPKLDHCDEVQLCAQGMCLEEMLDVTVPGGALFYGTTKRRHDVLLTAELRAETEQAALRLHELVASGSTPRAEEEPKCKRCSLVEVCQPGATGPKRSARRFLSRALARAISEGGEQA